MMCTMTSFGWKRKVGSSVQKEISKTFEANSKYVEDAELEAGDVDWLSLAPKRKCLQLEDACVKSERLRLEGITLAEAERFWEALKKWDEALQFTPDDEKLYEMRAQVLLSLGELYPAVCAAEKAVDLNTNWWIGHQTLGRAQLGLGEVKLALKSFSRALHINPANEELREDDLMWAAELVHRKVSLDKDELATATTNADKIHEVDADTKNIGTSSLFSTELANSCIGASCPDELKTLPPDYVAMRD